MIDDTVRVEVEGPAIATNVRASIASPGPAHAAPELTEQVRVARNRVALAETEVDRVASALERISATSIIEDDPTDDEPAAWGAIVSARRTVVEVRARRELALRERQAAARRELDEARRALVAAEDRERRTGSDRPAKQHEPRKLVEIELAPRGGATTGPVTVRLEYLVAAARWAPSYVARLDGDRVSVEVRAVVAQAAGEDWTGVPLKLSTAEPTRFAQLPELAAQRIGRRQHEPVRRGFRAPPTGAEALYADYEREVRPLRAPTPADLTFRRDEKTYIGKVPPQTIPMPAPAIAMPGTAIAPKPDDRRARSAPGGSAEIDRKPDDRRARSAPGGSAEIDRATLAGEVWDEETSAAKEAFRTPAEGRPMLAAAAPQRARRAPPKGEKKAAAGDMPALPEPEPERALASPATVPRLDYGRLVMAPPSSPERGKLVPARADEHAFVVDARVRADEAKIDALRLPPGCHADWTHSYDYAFATDGAVDVRADGAWHSLAVTARASSAKQHHVAVPREQPDVFRVAQIANPFAGPLLPGPIDVYDRGQFLVTSHVDYTPPGAVVDVGLGVDPAVKIARNTEFREEATGMLRGALRLHHAIAIDIENVSGRPVELEVRERIPVTRDGDDDVEVILGRVEPSWERWTPDPDAPRDRRLRGGYRWRVAVPAGGKRTLRAAYEIKIAGKLELVGGNRREA